jgi:hypothetical protein
MWIQIWTAMISLLILRYLKEIAKYGWSLSNLIAFLRMNLFVKIQLLVWLDNPFKPPEDFSKKIARLIYFSRGIETEEGVNLSNMNNY